MDPYDEQRLRNEVIYLHSLWRQGPPRPYNPNFISSSSETNPQEKRQRNKRGKNGKKKPKNADASPSSAVEWPCKASPERPPLLPSGWPEFKSSRTNSKAHLPSPGEQARFAANQAHLKAMNAVSEFLKYNTGDDEDGDASRDSSDEDDLVGEEGTEEDRFFTKVFNEETELRDYYQKNYGNGDFSCLVCGGLGRCKMFKSSLALVQHTITIARTPKRRIHRAYGQAICRILGWDIDKLSNIASAMSGNQGGNFEQAGETQVNADATKIDVPSLPCNDEDSAKNTEEFSLVRDDSTRNILGSARSEGESTYTSTIDAVVGEETTPGEKMLENVTATASKSSVDLVELNGNEANVTEAVVQIVEGLGQGLSHSEDVSSAIAKAIKEDVNNGVSQLVEAHKEELPRLNDVASACANASGKGINDGDRQLVEARQVGSPGSNPSCIATIGASETQEVIDLVLKMVEGHGEAGTA